MKRHIIRFLILCAIGFGTGGVFAFMTMDDYQAPDAQNISSSSAVSGTALNGQFDLLDETGRDVTHNTWDGRAKLVFFGFTHCPDVCPAALGKISVVLDSIGDEAEYIAPLFITVDPARDTAMRMAEYTDMFDPRIVGLTGSQKQINEAIDNFKVYAARESTPEAIEPDEMNNMDHSAHSGQDTMMAHGDDMDDMKHDMDEGSASMGDHAYLMQHSGYIYLMGPDNAVLDVFPSDNTVQEMTDDITKALKAL